MAMEHITAINIVHWPEKLFAALKTLTPDIMNVITMKTPTFGDSKLQSILHFVQTMSKFHIYFPDVKLVKQHRNVLILPDIFLYGITESKPLMDSLYSHLDIGLKETADGFIKNTENIKKLYRVNDTLCTFNIIANDLQMKTRVYSKIPVSIFHSIQWAETSPKNHRSYLVKMNMAFNSFIDAITKKL